MPPGARNAMRSPLCLVLAAGVAAMRLPPEFGRPITPPPAALPPAAARDVAAEAAAAASLLRKDVLPLSGEESRVRPLIMLAVRTDSHYAQLIGELVQHISSGRRAGSSWVRPLALRTAKNLSLIHI